MIELPDQFAEKIVAWQASHGRNYLPWQQTRDPYRVWLSEIMLQQTQVATVLDYYARFLQRFPDVLSLARASQDEVMALWAGLGYYTRARNLHSCAKVVAEHYGGVFPPQSQELERLPGVGRSTAAAIAAFCFSERVAILDANVRRVLTRVLGFDADIAQAKNERALWDLATALLPTHNHSVAMPRYTQGLMDLGATVCTPRKPLCNNCPMYGECKAERARDPERYPVKTRKILRRSESWWILLLRNQDDEIWLAKRPDKGIWAGLYCPPIYQNREQAIVILKNITTCNPAKESVNALSMCELQSFLHVLTHRDLYLHPLEVQLSGGAAAIQLEVQGGWFNRQSLAELGLPAPMKELLDVRLL